MEDVGAKVRQLPGFMVAQVRQAHGLCNLTDAHNQAVSLTGGRMPAEIADGTARTLGNMTSPLQTVSGGRGVTLRGSALYTPLTSVQIVMWALRKSAPMMVAL